MFSLVFALVLLGIGFVAGYGVRALISRKRRALAREELSRKRDQKRYDEGLAPNPPSIAFSVPDEALEAAANADQLANPSCHPSLIAKSPRSRLGARRRP